MSTSGAPSHAPPPRTLEVRALLRDGALPLKLELVGGEAGLAGLIGHPRIQKPGLALVGHFQGVSADRVQVLGETEVSYVESLPDDERARACERFFAPGFRCVIVTAQRAIPRELVTGADAAQCALFRSPAKSSTTINALHAFLDDQLAARTRVHGVFVDVYGVGILLLGKSGIGKSECALELVQRGHRLVADDVVDCTLRPPDYVYGAASELLKNHLEVRGLGVLNIKDLFGVAAVRGRKRLHMVIQLMARDEHDHWDRLGIDDETYEVLGVALPRRSVPVRPGKNTANTVEVAARNELLRQAGHHSARDFHTRLAAALGVSDPGGDSKP